MMRSGRLLVEESPANLLRDYGLSSLEDVFLKLCLKDDGNVPAGQSTESNLVALKDTDQISAQQPPNGHVNMSVQQGTSLLDPNPKRCSTR
jgi:hypothetical protein